MHIVDFRNPLILYTKDMPGIKPLLSPAAVAAILGIQPHQLAMWRHRRIGIPWIKIGEGRVGAVRYHPDDVDAFLKAHRRQVQRLAHITTDGTSKRAKRAARLREPNNGS